MFGLYLTYKYLSFTAPPTDAPIPPAPDGLERHFLTTPSGRIELLIATPSSPSPSSTPILFVHGGMGSAWVWTPYMQYLSSHGVPCYAVSMRGHGHSWYPSYLRMVFGTFRRDLTDDVLGAVRYVEEEHGEKVLLVGHSSGGGLSQGMLADGKVKVKGLALLGAVPCFGSYVCSATLAALHGLRPWLYREGEILYIQVTIAPHDVKGLTYRLGVYKNWARADPWFSLRMLFHLYHPNSPLSHPILVRRIFFSPSYPESSLMDFWAHGSRFEAFFWPFSMMYNFASPAKVLRAVLGGERGGDRVMVMTGTRDVIMSGDIMRDLGEVYRREMGLMGEGKKVDTNDGDREEDGQEMLEVGRAVRRLEGQGGEDTTANGTRVTWVPGAGHHLQNDVQWQVGAEKLLAFYEQL